MSLTSNNTAVYELVPVQYDDDAPLLDQSGAVEAKPAFESDEPLHIEFNKGSGTFKACIVGLVFTWILGAGAFGSGIYLVISAKDQEADSISILPLPMTYMVAEVITLAINLLITVSIDSTGFIHGASLRWALQREGRLTFNSNLRLLTRAKTSLPNGWIFNMLALVCTVLAYACSALMLHKGEDDFYESTTTTVYLIGITPIPLLIFGLAFLGQASICTWTLVNGNIPTWSSSPIDTVLACLYTDSLHGRPGRCMASVHEAKLSSQPLKPKAQQGSAWAAHNEVKRIVIFIWILVPICALWAITLFLVLQFTPFGILGQSWALIPYHGYSTNCGSGTTYRECTTGSSFVLLSPIKWSQAILSQLVNLLIFAIIQAVVTLGLHCAELQVNLSRDEAFWRSATSKKGCQLSKYSSLTAAVTSWQSAILFISKAVIHWMFGLAAATSNGLSFGPVQVVYLAIVTLVFASFTTYISTRKPKGPQPATYGHLQTLADLIDDWSPTIYWGHKSGSNPCHAGTSPRPLLLPVRMNEAYAGFWCE